MGSVVAVEHLATLALSRRAAAEVVHEASFADLGERLVLAVRVKTPHVAGVVGVSVLGVVFVQAVAAAELEHSGMHPVDGVNCWQRSQISDVVVSLWWVHHSCGTGAACS